MKDRLTALCRELGLEDPGFFPCRDGPAGLGWGISLAVRAAREAGARLLCFGHTHEALCEFENGLWIVNPGAAGSIARPTYAVAVLEGDGAVCYLSNI